MSGSFVSWEEAVAWLISQPDKADLVRNCYYDASPVIAAKRYRQSAEWQAVCALLPSTKGQALDLGAGRGIASYALAQDGWSVIALEPDPSNLVGGGAISSIAISEVLPIEVLHEFGEHIPCATESFDLVFARQVLHHAHDISALCAEVFRLLKPGGKFIAIRDHVISSPRDINVFWQRHPLHQLYGGENAYMPYQYMNALRSAGFSINQVLRSFDSVINYAPYTRESLRDELKVRLKRLPLGAVVGKLLDIECTMTASLALLSLLDRRPGRLYSFICSKPKN